MNCPTYKHFLDHPFQGSRTGIAVLSLRQLPNVQESLGEIAHGFADGELRFFRNRLEGRSSNYRVGLPTLNGGHKGAAETDALVIVV